MPTQLKAEDITNVSNGSQTLAELIPTEVYIENMNKTYPIKRASLAKLEQYTRLMRDLLGDVFDAFSGKASAKILLEVNDLNTIKEKKEVYLNSLQEDYDNAEDGEAKENVLKDVTEVSEEIIDLGHKINVLREKAIEDGGLSPTKIVDLILNKMPVAYEIIALALNEKAEWVADTLNKDEAMDVLTIVLGQEFGANFTTRKDRLLKTLAEVQNLRGNSQEN